jgi:hypothetical protein
MVISNRIFSVKRKRESVCGCVRVRRELRLTVHYWFSFVYIKHIHTRAHAEYTCYTIKNDYDN